MERTDSKQKISFPLTEPHVHEYIVFLQKGRAPATRADLFFKAANFETTALRLYSGHTILDSELIAGAVFANLDRNRFTNQAPPIPAEGVTAMEEYVIDKSQIPPSRIIVGFALWCTGHGSISKCRISYHCKEMSVIVISGALRERRIWRPHALCYYHYYYY